MTVKYGAKHIARKRFGQNFLVDDGIIDSIVASIAPQRSDNLVEIGPGLGALTAPLLARLDRLQVIEIDRDLIARFMKATCWNLISPAWEMTCESSAICPTTSRRRCCSVSPNTPAASATCT
jgi:hypothetical protein